jgi:hypothetical protein
MRSQSKLLKDALAKLYSKYSSRERVMARAAGGFVFLCSLGQGGNLGVRLHNASLILYHPGPFITTDLQVRMAVASIQDGQGELCHVVDCQDVGFILRRMRYPT